MFYFIITHISVFITFRIGNFFGGRSGSGTVNIYTDPDPAPDPSINKQKIKKNLDFFNFVTSLSLES